MTRLKVQRRSAWRFREVRWIGPRVQWVISPVQCAVFTFPAGNPHAAASHVWSISPVKR